MAAASLRPAAAQPHTPAGPDAEESGAWAAEPAAQAPETPK